MILVESSLEIAILVRGFPANILTQILDARHEQFLVAHVVLLDTVMIGEIAMEARALFAVHLQIVADVAKLLVLVLIAHFILLGWSKIANNLGWERFSSAILTYRYH